MTRPFPWAIAGFGKVAAGGHHHGIQAIGHKLAGLTTRDAAIRKGDASHVKFNWGTNGLKFDASRLIVSEKPDDTWLRSLRGKAEAVIVCVPTQFHHETVERVLRAGFHCLVEKPFAETAVDARDLMQLATTFERKLLVAQILPAFQEFGALRDAILMKGLGQLKSLSMRRWVPWKGVSNHDQIAASTGYFADLAVHDAHFLASLGGDPMIVSFETSKCHNRVQHANVTIEFATARSAKITIDVGANAGLQGEFEHGFEAAWSDGWTMSLKNGVLTTKEGPVPLKAEPVGDIFGRELSLAAKHFRDGKDAEYLAPGLAHQALSLIETVCI